MALTYNAIINFYSFFLLSVVLFYIVRHTEAMDTLQQKLFFFMIQITMIMLIIDTLSRFDGKPGTYFEILNYIGNLLIYAFNPILPSIWLLYIHCQIYGNESKTKKLMKPLITFAAMYLILYTVSQFYGWFYYIDAENIYHRGQLFFIPVVIPVIFILVTLTLIVVNRKNIDRKYFNALLFFVAPPIACIVLQIVILDYSLLLNGVTVSLIIAFLYIQNQHLYTDCLTGVYNRKWLKAYLNEKICSSTSEKTFSAIFIDIDNFKYINDTYGHDVGDDALEACASLLKNCMKNTDFIARFGGDEFYLILDVPSLQELEKTVSRIRSSVAAFNRESRKPYQIGLSMGYAVYDYEAQMNAEEFQKMIDDLMYQNKRRVKKLAN